MWLQTVQVFGGGWRRPINHRWSVLQLRFCSVVNSLVGVGIQLQLQNRQKHFVYCAAFLDDAMFHRIHLHPSDLQRQRCRPSSSN